MGSGLLAAAAAALRRELVGVICKLEQWIDGGWIVDVRHGCFSFPLPSLRSFVFRFIFFGESFRGPASRPTR
jgi:hypothetical protein